MSVAAALGLPDKLVEPIITAIVVLASVTIGAIGYEDGSEKGNPGPVDPDPPLAQVIDPPPEKQ